MQPFALATSHLGQWREVLPLYLAAFCCSGDRQVSYDSRGDTVGAKDARADSLRAGCSRSRGEVVAHIVLSPLAELDQRT
jgi:hypothetical protein